MTTAPKSTAPKTTASASAAPGIVLSRVVESDGDVPAVRVRV
jgi:hypothetical protein